MFLCLIFFNFFQSIAELAQVKKALKLNNKSLLPNSIYTTPVGPTFYEFVSDILSHSNDDEHWRPYNRHCSPCLAKYDIMIK